MRGGYVREGWIAATRPGRVIPRTTLTITPEAGWRTRTEVRAPRILGDEWPIGWHPARFDLISGLEAAGTGRKRSGRPDAKETDQACALL